MTSVMVALLGAETATAFVSDHVVAKPERIVKVLNGLVLEDGSRLYVDYYPLSDAIMTTGGVVIWEKGKFL
jgi:hypothetical protein